MQMERRIQHSILTGKGSGGFGGKRLIIGLGFYLLCLILVATTQNVGKWQKTSGSQNREAIMTICMQDKGWVKQPANLEKMVLQRMNAVAPEESSPEMNKALAVVLRSELLARKELQLSYAGESGANLLLQEGEWAGDDMNARLQQYEQAVEETRGIYLSYEGSVIVPLWTYLTNGSTRDGVENHLENAPYLQKMVCESDILESNYTSSLRVSRARFCKLFAKELQGGQDLDGMGWPDMVCERDSAGYVTKVYLGEEKTPVEGGDFAERMGLASPDFTWKYLDDAILFQVTGYGHGFGMSLISARKLAREGRDFMAILRHFYPDTELKKL